MPGIRYSFSSGPALTLRFLPFPPWLPLPLCPLFLLLTSFSSPHPHSQNPHHLDQLRAHAMWGTTGATSPLPHALGFGTVPVLNAQQISSIPQSLSCSAQRCMWRWGLATTSARSISSPVRRTSTPKTGWAAPQSWLHSFCLVSLAQPGTPTGSPSWPRAHL